MNMLRHVLGVLGMTSQVVRHEEYADGVLDDADLVIVGPGPGDPRDDDDPKMRRLRAAVARLLARGAAVPRRLPGPPGAVPPAGASRWPTRTSSSRAPSRRCRSTGATERVGFYNTFVGRLGGVARPAGVRVEADAGDRRHPPARGPALPRHPVPRRVDPHRARLRPAALAGARPAVLARTCCRAGGPACPSHRSNVEVVGDRLTPVGTPDVVVVDHYDSYTWNLVHLVAAVTGGCRGWWSTTEVGAEEVLRHSHVVLSPGPRPPRRSARLRGRARGAARRQPAGARRLPRHAGPGHGVRRHGRPRASPPTARSPRSCTTAAVSSPACPSASARCATTRWRPPSSRRARAHRLGRRRTRQRSVGGPRHRDGGAPPHAAAGGRAVPPRVDPLRARRPTGRATSWRPHERHRARRQRRLGGVLPRPDRPRTGAASGSTVAGRGRGRAAARWWASLGDDGRLADLRRGPRRR